MQSLCLSIEYRLGVYYKALLFVGVVGKLLLLYCLYLFEFRKYAVVVFKLLEIGKLHAVVYEPVADALDKQIGKLGIGLAEPSSVCNAVCYICKFIGRKIVIILEYRLFDYLAVERRNAVYAVAAVHGKICHLNSVVLYYRHPRDFCPLAGESVPKLFAEFSVYFFDYRMNSGNGPFNKVFLPCFERFGKYRMVCVCARCRRYRPCVIPLIIILVNEYSHEFCNCHCGMRVVEVDGSQLGKVAQVAVSVSVVADYVLNGRRAQEILLF